MGSTTWRLSHIPIGIVRFISPFTSYGDRHFTRNQEDNYNHRNHSHQDQTKHNIMHRTAPLGPPQIEVLRYYFVERQDHLRLGPTQVPRSLPHVHYQVLPRRVLRDQ